MYTCTRTHKHTCTHIYHHLVIIITGCCNTHCMMCAIMMHTNQFTIIPKDQAHKLDKRTWSCITLHSNGHSLHSKPYNSHSSNTSTSNTVIIMVNSIWSHLLQVIELCDLSHLEETTGNLVSHNIFCSYSRNSTAQVDGRSLWLQRSWQL